ncbi:MAG: hypothetical protein IRZ16_12670 [Myxococcaceae bacterium]|nr:hypothetical protein [Myxococcaceae bacterium]
MRRPARSPLTIPLACACVCALALCGCPKKEEQSAEDAEALLARAKGALAEREKKLRSYHLEGTVAEAGQRADFTFDYRAPNRMKGTVRVEDKSERTYSFDGDRLFVLAPEEKTLVQSELPKDSQQSAVMLTQLFGQFAPEGYRAPVLELAHADARKVSRPEAPEAVEISSATKDESGDTITVTYVYRWPSMDLLEKRLTENGNSMTLHVDEELCDERLKLCVPKKLTQKYGTQPGAVTTLSRIDFNVSLPNDAFTLPLPEGYTLKRQTQPQP